MVRPYGGRTRGANRHREQKARPGQGPRRVIFGHGVSFFFSYISRNDPLSGNALFHSCLHPPGSTKRRGGEKCKSVLQVMKKVIHAHRSRAGSFPTLDFPGKLAFPNQEYGTRHKDRGIGPHEYAHQNGKSEIMDDATTQNE